MSDWSRTVLHLGGRAVDALPPRLRSTVRSALMRPEPRSVTLEELDAVLARATTLMGPAPDEARALLDGIVLALPTAPPEDPFSDAYREWTWELYRTISGRAAYDTTHEASPFDLAAARERPFPYQTGSLALVGRDLVARGHLLECLAEAEALARDGAAPAPSDPLRVVEFGPGWGNLTGDLVATGLDVTAVEVDEKFCQLIAHRCTGPGRVDVVQGDMLGLRRTRPSTPRCSSRASTTAPTTSHCCTACTTLCGPAAWCSSPPSQSRSWTTRGGRGSTAFPCGRAAPTAGSNWVSTSPTSTAPSPAPAGRADATGCAPVPTRPM
jgi:hypothetical protein